MAKQMHKKMNFKRNTSDYYWIIAFYLILYVYGQYFYPQKTKPDHAKTIYNIINVAAFSDLKFVYITYWIIASISLSGITAAVWHIIKYLDPKICMTYFDDQMKAIRVNMILLAMMETIWTYITVNGYTKITMDRTDMFSMILDSFCWILGFELSWYTQHRLMHDNKILWTYGHQYHHSWNTKDHMIGITNFAFDHVVEIWVTMASSFIPVFIFPINFYLKTFISLVYMIIAVLVHWDGFPWKYHLNHHYKVVKNYGSHIPIFDVFFGTYYPQ
eukprot:194751_1